jgi:hypothetical protein
MLCVFCFKASRHYDLDQPGWLPLLRRVFGLGFVAQPRNLYVVNHYKPRELGAASRNATNDLGFESQPRNRTRLRLTLLATMPSTLDPVGHWVPRTKPTCLSTPRGHTDIDLSCLFVTCTSTNQAASLKGSRCRLEGGLNSRT